MVSAPFFYANLLTQLIRSQNLSSAQTIHAHILKSGLHFLTNFLSSALINLYSQSPPTLKLAHQLFDEIPQPNVVAYTTLISAYSRANLPSPALQLSLSMLRRGVPPNEYTLSTIIHACASISDLDVGLQFHSYGLKAGLDQQSFVASSILDMYAKCGVVGCARLVFDAMPERDEVAWGSIICCYAQNREPLRAMELFARSRAAVMYSNMFLLSGVLRACAEMAAHELGKAVHAHALIVGIDEHAYIRTGLVDMYGKCGNVDDAVQVFRSVDFPGLPTWNAMLMAYALVGNMGDTSRLFHEMVDGGIRPNHVTFLAITTACTNSGSVEEARYYLNSMKEDFGLQPEITHYGCLVSVLGRVGLIAEAEDCVLRMPLQPDRTIWRLLLSACSFHQNTIIGERVAARMCECKNMSELDGDAGDASQYVLLSNMHANDEGWEKMADIREEMSRRRVEKEIGRSWIESEGSVNVFVSGDQEHHNALEIYRLLDVLMEEMKS